MQNAGRQSRLHKIEEHKIKNYRQHYADDYHQLPLSVSEDKHHEENSDHRRNDIAHGLEYEHVENAVEDSKKSAEIALLLALGERLGVLGLDERLNVHDDGHNDHHY